MDKFNNIAREQCLTATIRQELKAIEDSESAEILGVSDTLWELDDLRDVE
ncbi:MAG TPA: hypothetical protein VJL59_13920 [Anaerolineales bacterium]|nr:hypothetical protein [Anaerolineales bacterium]